MTYLLTSAQIRAIESSAIASGQVTGQGLMARVVIHPCQQDHIGIQRADHPQRRADLWIVAAQQIAQQQSRTVPFEPRIPRGDPQHLGPCGQACHQQRKGQGQTGNQAGAKISAPSVAVSRRLARIISLTRAMAIPRMNRLAGRKDHAVIVQTRVCGAVRVRGSKPLVP